MTNSDCRVYEVQSTPLLTMPHNSSTLTSPNAKMREGKRSLAQEPYTATGRQAARPWHAPVHTRGGGMAVRHAYPRSSPLTIQPCVCRTHDMDVTRARVQTQPGAADLSLKPFPHLTSQHFGALTTCTCRSRHGRSWVPCCGSGRRRHACSSPRQSKCQSARRPPLGAARRRPSVCASSCRPCHKLGRFRSDLATA